MLIVLEPANYHVGEALTKINSYCKKHGIDISGQKCRQIQTSDFETFDFIYVMDKNNYKNVLAIAPNEKAKSKVQLILNESKPGQNSKFLTLIMVNWTASKRFLKC